MSEMKWKEFPQQPELSSSILVLHMGEENLFVFFFLKATAFLISVTHNQTQSKLIHDYYVSPYYFAFSL